MRAAAGVYNPRTTYTILSAAGGVSGQCAGVTSNLAFLSPGLRYLPDDVDLALTRNDVPFAASATSRSGIAPASAGTVSAAYETASPRARRCSTACAGATPAPACHTTDAVRPVADRTARPSFEGSA